MWSGGKGSVFHRNSFSPQIKIAPFYMTTLHHNPQERILHKYLSEYFKLDVYKCCTNVSRVLLRSDESEIIKHLMSGF